LGVGGLGCSVALALVRLGFRKVILVDKDVVDAHNLNRQILFSRSDIGKPKVPQASRSSPQPLITLRQVVAAERGLQSHNLRTEIVPPSNPLHASVVLTQRRLVTTASR
jgi:molybdopterin/thiamine biosynthesis adenylyltransferase